MSKNLFNSIKLQAPNRNLFDLSHDVKLTCNMGQLVPTLVQFCVPGDRITIGTDALVRASPLIAPVMHRANVMHHTFFVPLRILWQDMELFFQGAADSADPDFPYSFPTVTIDAANYTRLMDFMGIPTPDESHSEVISAMPFAAYQLIWNEYYRDQNLQDAIVAPQDFLLVDGDNTSNLPVLGVLKNRAWMHDYFTSALPFAQKGSPVNLPLSAPIDVSVYARQTVEPGELDFLITGTTLPSSDVAVADVPFNTPNNSVGSDLYADTSALDLGATTINDLRTAIAVQEWLELAARAGTRYTEQVKANFNVDSKDARLQRPEFICGSSAPIVFSEVLNTTGTSGAAQGAMAGHGVSLGHGKPDSYYCTEHGYIISVMSILPVTAYQQGIPRHFYMTNDYTDFYWPKFANLGEQSVLQGEIYAFNGNSADTFGYVPRYAEYRFNFNRVAGLFRTSLNFWHMGRIFSSSPSLNEDFVVSDPTDRVFATIGAEDDHMLVQIVHNIMASRLMPKWAVPSFM